jgi:hypothetical protein
MGRRLGKQTRGAAANVARGQTLGLVDPTLDCELAGALLMGGIYQALSVSLTRTDADSEQLVSDLTVFMARVLAISEA